MIAGPNAGLLLLLEHVGWEEAFNILWASAHETEIMISVRIGGSSESESGGDDFEGVGGGGD